jgi:uncharacterized lipoprotein YajG
VKKLLFSLSILFLAACAATTDPLKATYDGCTATRAAVQATDAALLSGKISKADAQKAFAGFTAMQAGCNAAVTALTPAIPASGVAK